MYLLESPLVFVIEARILQEHVPEEFFFFSLSNLDGLSGTAPGTAATRATRAAKDFSWRWLDLHILMGTDSVKRWAFSSHFPSQDHPIVFLLSFESPSVLMSQNGAGRPRKRRKPDESSDVRFGFNSNRDDPDIEIIEVLR